MSHVVASPPTLTSLKSHLSVYNLYHVTPSQYSRRLTNPILDSKVEKMSNDIFADFAGGARSNVGGSSVEDLLSKAPTFVSPFTMVPRDPGTQMLVDAMDAEEEIQRARKERELDTPENRQKAAEAELAERERKKIDFHFKRAIPRFLWKGWKHLRQELTDEEVRVYTTDYKQRRFWGIKPAGIGMFEFWEINDPKITRYDDNVAVTWEDPLIPPPITAFDENNPVIWAGRGVDPDLTPPKPLVPEAPPPTKATTSRRRLKTPEINPAHRVRKSKTSSPKISKKGSRKALADERAAENSRLEGHVLEERSVPPATDGPSQDNAAIPPTNPSHKPTTKTKDPAPLKPTQSRPSRKATAAPADPSPQPPKRPRGRPAKPKLPPKDKATSSPKRPRGRPPGKGKSTAVQGNARVTKASSQQKGRRALAPSTHVMRTRGKGTAGLLQL